MENPDLDYLNLKDLKSVCKYYKIEHASRVKRVELEALIFMAEHSQALAMMHVYNNMPVTEEELDVIHITPDTSNNSPE
jgi:hypothetical protein